MKFRNIILDCFYTHITESNIHSLTSNQLFKFIIIVKNQTVKQLVGRATFYYKHYDIDQKVIYLVSVIMCLKLGGVCLALI